MLYANYASICYANYQKIGKHKKPESRNEIKQKLLNSDILPSSHFSPHTFLFHLVNTMDICCDWFWYQGDGGPIE